MRTLTVAQLKKELETMRDEDLVFLEGADHTLKTPDTRQGKVYSNGADWLEWEWESVDETTVGEAHGLVLW